MDESCMGEDDELSPVSEDLSTWQINLVHILRRVNFNLNPVHILSRVELSGPDTRSHFGRDVRRRFGRHAEGRRDDRSVG